MVPEGISERMFEQSAVTRFCHSVGIRRDGFRDREGQQLSTLAKRSFGMRLAIEALLPDGLAWLSLPFRNTSVSKGPSMAMWWDPFEARMSFSRGNNQVCRASAGVRFGSGWLLWTSSKAHWSRLDTWPWGEKESMSIAGSMGGGMLSS